MHIVSLKKLVEDNDINQVSVFVGEGVGDMLIDVGTPEYREYENYIVKGEYRMNEDPMTRVKTVYVTRLEKGLEITLNHPEIESQEAVSEATEDAGLNTPVTAIVFNRHSLESAGRETRRQHVTAYAHTVLESFRKNFGEAELEDFAVVEIDWDNRTVSLKSIAVLPAESTDEA